MRSDKEWHEQFGDILIMWILGYHPESAKQLI